MPTKKVVKLEEHSRQESTRIEASVQLGKRNRKSAKKYIDMEASESDDESVKMNPTNMLNRKVLFEFRILQRRRLEAKCD